LHTTDARAAGETEQRFHALAAWREALFFFHQERAALDLLRN
jgi:alkylhydroperoxidase family enzyme